MADFKTGSVRANEINFHFLEMGEGPLVLCLHGFPDHAYSFRHLLPELAQAGFRAVAPFMRGYAPTEAPKDGRYQMVLMSKDVLALIGALGADQAYLIGNDWGASAASGAAILEPEKVIKLVIIAFLGFLPEFIPSTAEGVGMTLGQADENMHMDFHYLKGIWHSYYFLLPFAERTLAHNDFAFVEDWWRDSSPEWDIPKEALESIRETFRKPGVVEAAVGYYRSRYNLSFQDPSQKEGQERIDAGPITVPTLALHGTRDRPRRLDAFQSKAMDRFLPAA